jgi:hypothetical protein
VAKASDCKSDIAGSNPAGASLEFSRSLWKTRGFFVFRERPKIVIAIRNVTFRIFDRFPEGIGGPFGAAAVAPQLLASWAFIYKSLLALILA